jgi:aspartyl-tRNA(Asn)/glutamyl-tRNA(Gln) amidotransferase subunit B
MVELPQEKKDRYVHELGLEPDTAEMLVSSKLRAAFFEECMVQDSGFSAEVAKWIIGDLAMLMKKNKVGFTDLKVKPEYLAELIQKLQEKKITGTIAKKVLEQSFETGQSPSEVVEREKLEVQTDESEIEKFVDEAIKSNKKVVSDILKNPNAIKFLVGQVMRISKGQANPQVVEKILRERLGMSN